MEEYIGTVITRNLIFGIFKFNRCRLYLCILDVSYLHADIYGL